MIPAIIKNYITDICGMDLAISAVIAWSRVKSALILFQSYGDIILGNIATRQ